MSYRSFVLLAASALALAACDDDPNEPENTASVRFVNASVINSAVNATIGGTSVASNIGFQSTANAGACVNVPAGTQSVGFSAATGGAAIGTGASTNFVAGQRYTVVLYGNGTTQVYQDQFTAPSSGNNAIRFINGTSTAADIYGTTATGTVTGTPPVSNLAAFTATGSSGGTAFSSFANTNVRWRSFDVGTKTTARGDFTLANMPANGVTTVIFTPSASAGGATGFMVNPC
jgi:hypothetical protein